MWWCHRTLNKWSNLAPLGDVCLSALDFDLLVTQGQVWLCHWTPSICFPASLLVTCLDSVSSQDTSLQIQVTLNMTFQGHTRPNIMCHWIPNIDFLLVTNSYHMSISHRLWHLGIWKLLPYIICFGLYFRNLFVMPSQFLCSEYLLGFRHEVSVCSVWLHAYFSRLFNTELVYVSLL